MTTLKSNESRAKWASILILLVMIASIILLFLDTLEYQLLHSNFTAEEADANDFRQRIFAFLYLILFIISAITFIRWFRRAYYNLHQKATQLEYAENVASYSWFIPFVNWIRPFQIIKELYLETQVYLKRSNPNFIIKAHHPFIGIWWALWIITNILSNIQVRIALENETIQDYVNSNVFSMINNLLEIPLAIVTILLIKDYAKLEAMFYTVAIQEDQNFSELKSYKKEDENNSEEIMSTELT